MRDPTSFHSEKLHKALQDGDTKTVARIILNKNKVNIRLADIVLLPSLLRSLSIGCSKATFLFSYKTSIKTFR